MYWATVFVYDNTKNTQMNADIEFNQEISFKESPASGLFEFNDIITLDIPDSDRTEMFRIVLHKFEIVVVLNRIVIN